MKGRFKKFKYPVSPVLTKTFKKYTTFNLVTVPFKDNSQTYFC